MSKQILGLLVVCFLSVPAILRADDLSDNFSASLNQVTLDALAKDLGAVAAGGSFHQGKALGFPIGVDVGVHVPVVGISDENAILKDDLSSIAATFAQAELGLPAHLNVIARYGKIVDQDIIGGGLRYGIFNPSLPGLPSLSVEGLYHQMSHDYFDMKVVSANAVLSFDIPLIHPYIGAGYDMTTLDPTAIAYVGAPASSAGLSGKSNGYRAEVGVNISLIPFTYLTLGAGLANGEKMVHGGFGLKI